MWTKFLLWLTDRLVLRTKRQYLIQKVMKCACGREASSISRLCFMQDGKAKVIKK